MRYTMNKVLLLGLMILLLTACGGAGGAELEGTTWELTAIPGQELPAEVSITAEFSEGQIAGSAGCNSYSGSYQTNADQIVFGEMIRTLMACLEPEGVMELESAYIDSLLQTQTYQVDENTLQLINAQGEALIFSRR